MPEVQRSPEARTDLLQIWLHIAERNPQAADRLLDLIDQKCRLLAEMPGLGRARPELRPDLRSFPVGQFLILYRPMGDSGIEIVRIVRGVRDLAILFEA
jgi:toxin ParE1/3/4